MNIKEIRALTGLSQVDFAKHFNIPRRTVENWECGISSPPEYLLQLLEYRVTHEKPEN
nr:MAG TPA: putative transcriptional regulator [Caudoviricetes sp.]